METIFVRFRVGILAILGKGKKGLPKSKKEGKNTKLLIMNTCREAVGFPTKPLNIFRGLVGFPTEPLNIFMRGVGKQKIALNIFRAMKKFWVGSIDIFRATKKFWFKRFLETMERAKFIRWPKLKSWLVKKSKKGILKLGIHF